MTDGFGFTGGHIDEREVWHEEREQEIEYVSHLHPLLTWSELWVTLDHLTVRQIRLEKELAQVNTELLIVNERLRVMANCT